MSEGLHAILIQTADGDSLLLPNSAVAEVVTLDRFERPDEEAPGWLAGWHATAERRVPVVFFEVLRGRPRPELNRRGRLVILHPLAVGARVGQYAILAQGQPQLLGVERSGIESADGPGQTADAEALRLARVRIGGQEGQEALIPDLEAIVARLAGLA
jgi:chemosensory pili system protein ChpC